MMNKIHCSTELATAIGLPPDADFSRIERAIYKYTACGAWITQQDVITEKAPKTWRVLVRRTIGGYRAIHARPDHGKTIPIPDWLKPIIPCNAAGFIEDTCTLIYIRKVMGNEREHIFPIENVRQPVTHPGVAIGSIVEGVDQCTEVYELAYPFTLTQFNNALNAVKTSAEAIWNDTHGCEDCDYEESDYGMPRVNPNCPTCKGLGIVI
jgi:hypothetical protein